MTARPCFVGLDIGGTYLKAARVASDGAILEHVQEPVAKSTAEALFEQLDRVVRALASKPTSAGGPRSAGADQPVLAVGVGLPGIVDEDGRVKRAPNVPALNGRNVGNEIEARTGLKAVAENDANAAALAEAWIGAGRGSRHLLFMTLGTGVGGALILDGRLYTGRAGYAGEIGHLQVDPQGVPCGCGSWGCLETIAGNAGWTRRAEAALKERPSSLAGGALDPAAIVAAARDGDAVALSLVHETALTLAVGLAGAMNLLNPDRVVIGGGVAAAGEILLGKIVEEVRRRTFHDVFTACTIVPAGLGSTAGVVGATRAAMLAARSA